MSTDAGLAVSAFKTTLRNGAGISNSTYSLGVRIIPTTPCVPRRSIEDFGQPAREVDLGVFLDLTGQSEETT